MNQNLKIYTKRSIKFKTVETATQIFVFAILLEQNGNEITYSEPKIIKVIAKQTPLLNGQVGLQLSGINQKTENNSPHTVSPYFSYFSLNKTILTWYGARPPCLN